MTKPTTNETTLAANETKPTTAKTTPTTEDEIRHLVLGEPLDQMLNADCKYPFQLSISKEPTGGGLILPNAYSAGTGNIVIRGLAGSGKSTFAMQMLCEAVRRNNHICAAYISLEETQPHIYEKARKYGWAPYVWPLFRFTESETGTSIEELADDLKTALTCPMACHGIGTVKPYIVPGANILKPRNRCCPHGVIKADGTSRPCPFRDRCNDAIRMDNEYPGGEKSNVAEYVSHPGIVILPQLLPHPFDPESKQSDPDAFFWKRYRQLDELLGAAKKLRENNRKIGSNERRLELVCIDSLNALGAGGLTRDHLAALFDLFKRRQMLGILVVEENERGVFAGDSQIDSDTIDFLADMVIRLTGREEEGYWLRHFQIEKSRHQKHVLGRHPFKIFGCSAEMENESPHNTLKALDDLLEVTGKKHNVDASLVNLKAHLDNWRLDKPWRIRLPPATGLRIYPSVHTIVAASEHLAHDAKDFHVHTSKRTLWRSKELMRMVRNEGVKDSIVMTITGPATSGKSLIAGNFLLEGLSWGEDVILIRFCAKAEFSADGSWSSPNNSSKSDVTDDPLHKRNDLVRLIRNEGDFPSLGNQFRKVETTLDPNDEKCKRHPVCWMHDANSNIKVERYEQVEMLMALLSAFDTQKIQYWIHQYMPILRTEVTKTDIRESQETRKPLLVEIAVKPGAVLPEEFLEIIREVYRWGRHFRQRAGFDIRRIALLDVGAIGYSYPLLKRSSTGSDIFLSAFAHMVRCRGTDLILTAETGGIADSEDIVKEAASLADEVLSCKHCDVFGDRYITVSGPGLFVGDMLAGKTPSSAPAVFRRRKGETEEFAECFEVECETLDGLVGFDSGHIRRPGVTLQFFEEGVLHKAYNEQVARLVRFAMGSANAIDGISTSPSVGSLFPDTPIVTVDAFNSVHADPFHRSLDLLANSPLHNTVIRTIDEFAARDIFGKTPEKALKPLHPPTETDRKDPYGDDLYYGNVLLLACDENTANDLEAFKTEPTAFWGKVGQLMNKSSKKESSKEADLVFICDERARETLACLAIDGAPTKADGNIDEWPLPDLKSYIEALAKVLPKAKPLMDSNLSDVLSADCRNLVENPAQRCARYAKQLLAEGVLNGVENEELLTKVESLAKQGETNGTPYLILCWYSHLREMMALYWRECEAGTLDKDLLATMLKEMQVCGLPGGGFKGDWYIHVPSGSVSESLGKRIKEVLLGLSENTKRFIEGVGLPRYKKTEVKPHNEALAHAKAWPGGNVSLCDVLRIHNDAKRRSDITRYPKIRGDIYAIMKTIRDEKRSATGIDAIISGCLNVLINEKE